MYETKLGDFYRAFTAAFTPPALPTDVFIIEGIAGRTVRVFKLFLSTIQTTAGVNTWFFNKHSTANAGGTAVATARIPRESGIAAALALVQHYTVNPTPGTSLGSVWTGRLDSPAATTAGIGGNVGHEILFECPIVLKGTAEGLAVNFAGVALPAGLSVVAGLEWAEGA